MADEEIESQVLDTQDLPDEAGEAQPAGEAPVAEKPGVEKPSEEVPAPGAAPVGKTYTEEEVRQREAQITSKAQAETAQYRKYAEQVALRQQKEEAEAKERLAAAKDSEAVERGIITQDEAEEKKAARAEIAQLQFERQQQRAQQEAEARIAAIPLILRDFEPVFGVKLNPEDFLGDTNIRGPADIILKGLLLANTQLKAQLKAATAKSETFDKGPGAGSTRSIGADRIFRGFAEGDPTVSRADVERELRQKGLL